MTTPTRPHTPARQRIAALLLASLALLSGCETALQERDEKRQGASVMQYLFPGDDTGASMAPAELATLRVPLRIGVAFVPSDALRSIGATEAQQQQMLAQVVGAFERYPFVGELKPIPTTYLRSSGGLTDLERAATVFGVDVVALLSYDQVQFTEKTRSSVWYWTLIGAYLAQGDQYDIHTLIEATVIDVKSRRLLFRAAGTSVQKGGATASNVAETTRAARTSGFQAALDQMVPQLQASLEAFRAKARSGSQAGVKLDLPPGYDPAASRPGK
jgi:rhombotail lipoprotein